MKKGEKLTWFRGDGVYYFRHILNVSCYNTIVLM